MTALIVTASILFFICFILTVPVGIVLRWDDGFFLWVKVLFIKIRLLPKKEKKLRLRDFSKKRFEKILRKEKREKEKKQRKKAKKKQRKELKKQKKGSAGARLSELSSVSRNDTTDFLKVLYEMRVTVIDIVRIFGGHVHTRVCEVNVRVGASDAAKCAVLYGTVSQSVAYLLEFLDSYTKMSVRNGSVSVDADFEGCSTEARAELVFSSRLIHAISAAIRFAVKYYNHNENKKTGDKK